MGELVYGCRPTTYLIRTLGRTDRQAGRQAVAAQRKRLLLTMCGKWKMFEIRFSKSS